MGNGDETLLGEFPQGVYVRPHVQLTAHQHHFGVGTELLSLSLPLWKHENSVCVTNSADDEGTYVL